MYDPGYLRRQNSGNIASAAWGLAGPLLAFAAATATDTSSSGTVATAALHSIAAPTLAASAATTYTAAATLYIGGDPVAGTNVTITAGYGFWNAGKTRLDGAVTATSIAGPTTTNLTLAGGSTGASLVLGQGTNGAVTITSKGSGVITGVSDITSSLSSATFGGGFTATNADNSAVATQAVYFAANFGRTGDATVASGGDLRFGKETEWTSTASTRNGYAAIAVTLAGTKAEKVRVTSAGNVLVGGGATPTDITGSGGLKVFGTTAAVSSITGAFRVGNDTAATTVGIGGGNVYVGGVLNVDGATTIAGGLISYGANDTGGAGKRLVLVPNV